MKIKNSENNYIDDWFIGLLFSTIVHNDPISLSAALVYKSIGFENCDDCGERYYECCCEGDREPDSITGRNRPCRYCLCNYCLCEYDLDDYDTNIDTLVKEVAIKIAKKYLSKDQLIILQKKLINYRPILSERMKKYVEMLNEKEN